MISNVILHTSNNRVICLVILRWKQGESNDSK